MRLEGWEAGRGGASTKVHIGVAMVFKLIEASVELWEYVFTWIDMNRLL